MNTEHIFRSPSLVVDILIPLIRTACPEEHVIMNQSGEYQLIPSLFVFIKIKYVLKLKSCLVIWILSPDLFLFNPINVANRDHMFDSLSDSD